MRNNKLYPYIFSSLVVLISGFLLLFTQEKLYSKIKLNEQTFKYKELFKLIKVDVSSLSQKEISKKFFEIFKKENLKSNRFRYAVYNKNKLQGYLYPFQGMGFWNQIEGYVFTNPNLYEIKGIAITKQEETPGLGAEIERRVFLDKFQNKKITSPNSDKITLKLVPYGKSSSDNEIDGISGATETTKRFSLILHKLFENIVSDRITK